MAVESWVLNGTEFNDPGNGLRMTAVTVNPAAKRIEWLENVDADGAALLRAPKVGLRQHTYKLRVMPQADMDTALQRVGAIVDALQACEATQGGVDLVWTPNGAASSTTFTALAAELQELPLAMAGQDAGWFLASPVMTVVIWCLPLGDGEPLENITDTFATDRLSEYTFDGGASTDVAVTGGVLDAVNNLTTEKRFVHTASPYDLYDDQTTFKHTLGTTLTSYKAGAVVKRISATTYLECYVDDNGTNSRLRIDKVVSGSRTNLATTNLTRMTVSTAYWVRGRIEGDLVTAEHWTSAPTVTGTAATTLTHALTGGNEGVFGEGIGGRAGGVWNPQQTAASLDDLTIEPNLWRSSEPLFARVLYGVQGDADAKGELILTDGENVTRQYAEWGAGGDLTSALIIDSDSMVTTGYAGVQNDGTSYAITGAYDPDATGDVVISAQLLDRGETLVCAFTDQPHVGQFHVRARSQVDIYASPGDVQVWLRYRIAGGNWTDGPRYTFQVCSAWFDADLGLVSIPPALRGAQSWEGVIVAQDSGAAVDAVSSATLSVDKVELMPASAGYGKALVPFVLASPSEYDALDNFTASSGGLTGDTLTVGGTWAALTGSDTDDIQGSAVNEWATRTAVSDSGASLDGRWLTVSGLTLDAQLAHLVYAWSSNPSAGGNSNVRSGLVMRCVDNSNFLSVLRRSGTDALGNSQIDVGVVVGGILTATSGQFDVPEPTVDTWYRLLVAVDKAGLVRVWHGEAGLPMDPTPVVEVFDITLATGHTLEDGETGMVDANLSATACTRKYTNFWVAPLPGAPAIEAGRDLRVRDDDVALAASADGATYSEPLYHGLGFRPPAATTANPGLRVAARARRGNIDEGVDTFIDDVLQVQALWTPRVRVVPR